MGRPVVASVGHKVSGKSCQRVNGEFKTVEFVGEVLWKEFDHHGNRTMTIKLEGTEKLMDIKTHDVLVNLTTGNSRDKMLERRYTKHEQFRWMDRESALLQASEKIAELGDNPDDGKVLEICHRAIYCEAINEDKISPAQLAKFAVDAKRMARKGA